jgi:hypothetical protein
MVREKQRKRRMASPTPEQAAAFVLGCVKQERLRPGEDLLLHKLSDAGAQQGWSASSLTAGVEHGLAQGWFIAGPSNSLRLTPAGFAQITHKSGR